MAMTSQKKIADSSAVHVYPGVSRARRYSLVLVLFPLFLSASAAAQVTPAVTVDDECTAMAYAPDGRLAYAARRIVKTRRLEMQRDDIWLLGTDGKRRRIVNGEKLVQGPAAFSYAIQSLRWSPEGARLTVEMLTSRMINEQGDTQEGVLTLLVDENGKEIKIAGADSIIPDSMNATWLADGVTVVYLAEAVKPKLLYSIHSVRPIAGRRAILLADHAFAAVAWNAKQSTAVVAERDRSLGGPPRLVALDLLKETRRELTRLDGFVGGLSLSPSGTKVAYFREQDVLEIREVAAPERVARVRVAFGNYLWGPDERRILIKRGLERRSGDLVWVALPPLDLSETKPQSGPLAVPEAQPQPILHGLTFRDFAISPDGRFLAVTQPGRRNLLVYPLQ